MKTQKGSAHVVIVIVLVVALLGALGFIFWQNFVKPDEATKTEDSKTVKSVAGNDSPKDADLTAYQGVGYEFDYPSEDWIVKEIQYNYDNNGPTTTEVRTKDYKPAMGMGIDAGAVISINTLKNDERSTPEDAKQNAIMYTNATEVEDKTVAGSPAVSYFSAYEGERYVTSVFKDNLIYQITYQYAGDGSFAYASAYDTIVESFRFK